MKIDLAAFVPALVNFLLYLSASTHRHYAFIVLFWFCHTASSLHVSASIDFADSNLHLTPKH